MQDFNEQFQALALKYNTLLQQHLSTRDELQELRKEMMSFRERLSQAGISITPVGQQQSPPPVQQQTPHVQPPVPATPPPPQQRPQQQQRPAPPPPASKAPAPPRSGSDMERFIGQNLISKIGIIITIIGAAIGVKYSIDHDLISPAMRILLGYVLGLGLAGLGLGLRKRYTAYSAVLVSGAAAILYFVTFAAYDFYNLMPQGMAFFLMLVVTGGTVAAAILYDQPVIAHIGQVGAYSIPLLLSDGSGRAEILFSYMAVINAGIVAVALMKYWKTLYYAAIAATWFIFGIWYAADFAPMHQQALALTFLTIFFLEFHLLSLSWKFIRGKEWAWDDSLLLALNTAMAWLLGIGILDRTRAEDWQGALSLVLAGLHVLTALLAWARGADLHLRNAAFSIATVLVTLAVPLQLDAPWIAPVWLLEAGILFFISRETRNQVADIFSLPVLALGLGGLILDLAKSYQHGIMTYPGGDMPFKDTMPFLTGLLALLLIGAMLWQHYRTRDALKDTPLAWSLPFLNGFLPTLILTGTLLLPILRMDLMWYHFWQNSLIEMPGEEPGAIQYLRNDSLLQFRGLSPILFTCVWTIAVGLIQAYLIRKPALNGVRIFAGILSLIGFLSIGLIVLHTLQHQYLYPGVDQQVPGIWNIAVRYPAILLALSVLFSVRAGLLQPMENVSLPQRKLLTDIMLHVMVLVLLSSELLYTAAWLHLDKADKLLLSILWGAYSLFMVVMGIYRKQQHLRIAAIVIFAITLLKLFFHDIAHLDTLPKTIIFLALGGLLLLISFLYYRFRNLIEGEDAKKGD